MKVLITTPLSSSSLNFLRENLPECEFMARQDDRDLDISEVNVILGWKVPGELVEKTKKLKLIQTLSAGVDQVDIKVAGRLGVPVCKAPGHAVSVAEYTIMVILVWQRNFLYYNDFVKSKRWVDWKIRQSEAPSEIAGKSLGIIGFGSIGMEIAKKAKAFEMKIFAIKKHPEFSKVHENEEGFFIGTIKDIDYVLSKSDYVSINLPLTPETYYLINEEKLKKMKKNAFLISTSRGKSIDEKALYRALKHKWIAGAALDVMEIEPPALDNPLPQLKNLMVTPHIAGYTKQAQKRMLEIAIENIRNITLGKPLIYKVDPKQFY